MTSFIYFIQAAEDGPIKIGTTGFHPKKRMNKIQSDCPWPVRLLGAIEGGVDEEKQLHVKLAPFRTHGEWFSPDPIVKAAITEAICGGIEISQNADPTWKPRYSHPLHIWLCRNKIRASDFAKRIGVSQPLLTRWFQENIWISRRVATAIVRETKGEITANDFFFHITRGAAQ